MPATAPHRLLQKLFVPSLLDVFFCALLLSAFAHPLALQSLLSDGDTGWHIRTGELVLATGHAPVADPFSFTRAHQPWFAWEWLADVVFAQTWRWRGLAGVAALAGAILALAATALLARLLRRGSGLWIGLLATMGVVRGLGVAGAGRGRRVGRRDAGAGGHGTIGAPVAPRFGTVDRSPGDDGGGERFEHTLPGAATRVFDSFLYPRVVAANFGYATEIWTYWTEH